MAKIKPFNAYRYTANSKDLIQILFPLEEISSYSNKAKPHPHSIAFLSSAPHLEMGKIIQHWKNNGIITKDPLASIYVYYQYFTDLNLNTISCRKGFICLMKIEDWKNNVILKHEDILPLIEEYQAKLLSETKMYMNPIHGLYTDLGMDLDAYMDESMLNPIFEMMDNAGVTHKLSVIQDKRCILKFMDVLNTKKIVIADGHHRYSAALKLSTILPITGDQYIPAFLTNTENNIIPLLPFYRLYKIPDFDVEKMLLHVKPHYDIKEIKDIDVVQNQISQNLFTFGLLTRKTSYIIELKSKVSLQNYSPSNNLQNVDENLLEKLPYFNSSKNGLRYVHSINQCVEEINSNNADVAILFKELTINEVMTLSEKGLILPEKSTYFYPKVLGGIVMSSNDSSNGEMESPCFRDI